MTSKLIFYFLPEPTIHGGIKVGFQFSELLRQLGIDVVMATPDGRAPQWFPTQIPIGSRESILPNLTPRDRVIFSLPYDYDELKQSGAKLIFHCQGTDEAIVPILKDENVEVLSCWTQAHEFISGFSRTSENVGISISRSFFYSGEPKQSGSYAFMPRRGFLPNKEKLSSFHGRSIDEANEKRVSQILKTSSGFLALSENEWFGLPALEAMAAGCLVVSPKTIGGGEYLTHEENSYTEKVEDLAERMSQLLGDEQRYEHIRQSALETSYKYHPRMQFQKLQKIIDSGGLKFLR